MRVAIHQTTTGPDLATNADALEAAIDQANAARAQLTCFPEAVNILRGDQAELVDAIPDEKVCPVLERARSLAARHRMMIHLGSLLVRLTSGRTVNRSYLIDTDGSVIAVYDKIHLFDVDLSDGSDPESAVFDPGNEASVVDTQFGCIGLSICFDMRFSELFLALAGAGAEILMVPSSFSTITGPVHWLPLLKARAIETGCYVIAAAQSGAHESPLVTYGNSVAISPWGEVVCHAPDGLHMLSFELDLGEVRSARRKIPTLSLRREFSVRRIGHPNGQ